MDIDPKISLVINVIIAVTSALAGGAAMLTDLFGADTAKAVVAAAGLLGMVVSSINIGLHSLSGPHPGPLAAVPRPHIDVIEIPVQQKKGGCGG